MTDTEKLHVKQDVLAMKMHREHVYESKPSTAWDQLPRETQAALAKTCVCWSAAGWIIKSGVFEELETKITSRVEQRIEHDDQEKQQVVTTKPLFDAVRLGGAFNVSNTLLGLLGDLITGDPWDTRAAKAVSEPLTTDTISKAKQAVQETLSTDQYQARLAWEQVLFKPDNSVIISDVI